MLLKVFQKCVSEKVLRRKREELNEVEGEIDKTVAGLYGITDEELEEVKKTLGVLKGGDG